MRVIIGINNVDYCVCVWYVLFVVGLVYLLGSGVMFNFILEIENVDVLFIFGYNGVDLYLIVVNRIVKVKKNGVKLIVIDFRVIEFVRIVDIYLFIKGGINMVLVNVFGNVLIEEGFYNKEFV